MSQNEHFYANIEHANNDNKPRNTDIRYTYNKPLLDKQNEYTLTVKRVDLDTSLIPINNIQRMSALNLSMVIDSVTYNRDIKNFFDTKMSPPIYDIFYIDDFIKAVNGALDDIYTEAKNTDDKLHYYYNSDNQKMYVKIENPTQFNEYKNPVYMNNSCFQMFGEAFNNYYDVSNNRFVVTYIDSYNYIDEVIVSENTVSVTVYQEYPMISNLFECNKIIIISNSIGCRPESLSMTYAVNDSNNFPLNRFILFDFAYNPAISRKQVIYSDPNNDTRNIDLISDSNLSEMSLSVYYQTKQGLLLPVLQPVNTSFNMKMKFTYKKE